ncbi:hypothetical protein DPMN_100748 [Dreissena polymorpha]|uniref:Uncharacterized protein n=1 Tax=Dreissena polymorpha TaxID=45954 RepID=A0A9D4LGH0_DREPO|nr:hypothetical protein DPMN_100748 [Dreissena polymorpha]
MFYHIWKFVNKYDVDYLKLSADKQCDKAETTTEKNAVRAEANVLGRAEKAIFLG